MWCGLEAECVLSGTTTIVPDGNAMPSELYCFPPNNTDDSSSNDNSYCLGKGTSMIMTGFESQLSSKDPLCINLLFSDWTLDNSIKFTFACLGVLVLGLFIQYLTVLKMKTRNLTIITTEFQRRIIRMLLYGIQIVCTYFIMLVTMTYSVELFIMVAIGLTSGYAFFHSTDDENDSHNSNSGKKEVKMLLAVTGGKGLSSASANGVELEDQTVEEIICSPIS
jgi:hypothetical protein